MEFKIQGKRHVLRGASTSPLKYAKTHQFGKTRANGVHIVVLQACTMENEGLFHLLTTHVNKSRIPKVVDQLL